MTRSYSNTFTVFYFTQTNNIVLCYYYTRKNVSVFVDIIVPCQNVKSIVFRFVEKKSDR